jgi:hypothetical protein
MTIPCNLEAVSRLPLPTKASSSVRSFPSRPMHAARLPSRTVALWAISTHLLNLHRLHARCTKAFCLRTHVGTFSPLRRHISAPHRLWSRTFDQAPFSSPTTYLLAIIDQISREKSQGQQIARVSTDRRPQCP